VLLQDSGEAVARRFWERIGSPVLTDVKLAFEGLDVVDALPAELSDVWAERPLVVHTRYTRPGRGRVIVTGFRGGEPYREVIPVALPALERDHEALASIWARARVETLLRRDLGALQRGSYPEALREEVVAVALAYRLVTPFTSFVAVEERVVNRGGRLETVTVPVEMPQGVTHEGVFGEADASGGLASRERKSMLAYAAAPPTRSNGAAIGGSLAHRAEMQPAQEVLEEIAKTQPAEPLSQRARERLAPELLALLETSSVSPRIEQREGRVRVRVVLDAPSAELARRLEEAGLEVRTRADGWVEGWIEVADLAELAGQDGVRRIELP
jgi:Ca-activated chloride channel family protein